MSRRPPTIVVTRDEGPNGALTRALARRGARVFHLPAIAIAPPLDTAPLDSALSAPAGYDWVLFTSAHAVDAVCSRPAWAAARASLIAALANTRARPRPWRIAAVGPTTAERLASYGVPVDLVPAEAGAAGLTQALLGAALSASGRRRPSGGGPAAAPSIGSAAPSPASGSAGTRRPLAGSRILWPRSEIASRELVEALARAGAEITDPVAYRTVAAPHATRAREVCAKGGTAETSDEESAIDNGEDMVAGAALTGASEVRAKSGFAERATGAMESSGEQRAAAPGASAPMSGARTAHRKAAAAHDALPSPPETQSIATADALGDRAAEFRRLLDSGEIDGITFMSPSSARGLAAVLGGDSLGGLVGRAAIASIGPTTSAALASLGAPPDVQSQARTADDLAGALMSWLEARQEVPR